MTRPLLADLVGLDGVIRAIEPSAGIGRFILAFDALGAAPIRWTAVEYSALAAALLSAVRPGLSVFTGPFERWVARHWDEAVGQINLVISNPPFEQHGVGPKLGRVGEALGVDLDREQRIDDLAVDRTDVTADGHEPHAELVGRDPRDDHPLELAASDLDDLGVGPEQRDQDRLGLLVLVGSIALRDSILVDLPVAAQVAANCHVAGLFGRERAVAQIACVEVLVGFSDRHTCWGAIAGVVACLPAQAWALGLQGLRRLAESTSP